MDKDVAFALFVKFLHDTGAWDSYVKQIKEEEGKKLSDEEALRRMAKYTPATMFISGTFIWEESPQGLSYWSKLNKEWHATLKSVSNQRTDLEGGEDDDQDHNHS